MKLKKKMGNNFAQTISDAKGKPVTIENFEQAWSQFSRKDAKETISLNRVKRFLQAFALSSSVPYNPNEERRVRQLYDPNSTGLISKARFLHLFVQVSLNQNHMIDPPLLEESKKVEKELKTELNSEMNEVKESSNNKEQTKEVKPQKRHPLISSKDITSDNRHFHTLSFSCWVMNSKGKYFSWGHNNYGCHKKFI